MKEYSVLMSIVDFIPVAMFMISAVIMQQDFYNKMYKGMYALFAAGTIDVFMAGFLKALYKLLYALGICDFTPLSDMFFPVESLGFLLAGLAVMAMAFGKKKNVTALSAAPVVFKGTAIFVSFMVIGTGCIFAGLSKMAVKVKKYYVVALLVIAFFCYLSMGYLSTKDFDKAYMNWMGEGVNILGQSLLLVSLLIMRKAGVKEIEM